MKVKFYGTRGSIPISDPACIKYGGNTTSLRVFSDCLKPETALAIDTGTGFVPLSRDILKEKSINEVTVLFTHYHHDHTQGLLLSPLIFIKNLRLNLYGPLDGGVGPKRLLENLMRPPYFPVHFKEVSSHITCKSIEFPKTIIMLFHPKGSRIMNVDEYERITRDNGYIPIDKGRYPLDEFLVITQFRSRHPEQTVSYRFEEKPTGKIFVFLTDHENEDGIPLAFKAHVGGADLLVIDSQYSRERYDSFTAGYGHGTPDYCVKVAKAVGVKKLGLTHHDPSSKDEDIEKILEEAKKWDPENELEIFACADYLSVEV